MAGTGGGFRIGGFPTSGCGCCEPACDWTLCVSDGYCGPIDRDSTTVRFQGPDDFDETRHFYRDVSTGTAATADVAASEAGSLEITLTGGGSGYTSAPGYSWSGGTLEPVGGTPTAYPTLTITVSILTGAVTGITIASQPDVIWQTPPTLTIDAPPSRRLYLTTVCIENPAAGEWTLTISSDCRPTDSVAITVAECESSTITLPNAFAEQSGYTFPESYDYSDDLGSCTLSLLAGGCARVFAGTYSYYSTHAAETADCGYLSGAYLGGKMLKDQSGTIPVRVRMALVSISGGVSHWNVFRNVQVNAGQASCVVTCENSLGPRPAPGQLVGQPSSVPFVPYGSAAWTIPAFALDLAGDCEAFELGGAFATSGPYIPYVQNPCAALGSTIWLYDIDTSEMNGVSFTITGA